MNEKTVLSDEELHRTCVTACDSLNITRLHELGRKTQTIMEDAGLLEIGRAIERAVLERIQPVASEAEPLVRYCPGCGSIGPVEGKYRDCCPDGSYARMIPQALAEKCRDTFKVDIKVMMADAAANGADESAEPLYAAPPSAPASPIAEPVYTLTVDGILQSWKPTHATFNIPDGTHSLYLNPSASTAATADAPLAGHWRHSNGIVSSGTLRIFSADFDTTPAEEFQNELLDWVCATLNRAQSNFPEFEGIKTANARGDERAAFEKFYVDHFNTHSGKSGFTLADLESMRGFHGDYRDYNYVHGQWNGWQGRAALARLLERQKGGGDMLTNEQLEAGLRSVARSIGLVCTGRMNEAIDAARAPRAVAQGED